VFPNESSKTIEELAKTWINDKNKDAPTSNNCSKRSAPTNDSEEPDCKVQKLDKTSDSKCASVCIEEATDGGKITEDYKQAESGDGASKEIVSECCPFERVVFIDSTWNQTNMICNDERLRGKRLLN